MTTVDTDASPGSSSTDKNNNNKKKVLIVGAGVAGTALAARLSQVKGLQVTVVEKNGFTGGRCSLLHAHSEDGHYRFDRGPSLLLLPKLFQETFEDCKTTLEQEGIQLVQCDPNYIVHYGDGQQMKLSSDLTSLKSEIERFEGVDGFERFLQFLQEAHRHYELSVDHVLHRNFTSLFSMLRWGFLKNVFTLHPFTSIYTRASIYFKTERLRRAFTFSSMYMGMSPMDAPATYSLLQYTEIAEGIWYPKGGFHRIVQGLEDIARRQGADFQLNAPVKQVLVNPQGRASGVELESGQRLEADIVCINADLVYAYNHLLPSASTSYADRLAKRPSSCSSISFYWALNTQLPQLGAHNIFLADHYKESFDEIFKLHQMPGEPSFYVNVPSRLDPSAAPEGKDALVVLVPVGHMNPLQTAQDFDSMIVKARQHIVDVLRERIGVEDLSKLIVHEQVYDPRSWKEAFNLDKGSILGLSHDFFNVLSFRPKTRHSQIKNCYFAGASAHPGTGVPIVLAGAKITAEQILQDHGLRPPWSVWRRPRPTIHSRLDFVHTAWGWLLEGPGLVILPPILMALVAVLIAVVSRLDWAAQRA